MSGKRRNIAQNNKFHPCTGYGNIHSPEVIKESYLSFFVCADKTYKYHVSFLTLKAIYSIYCYVLTVWFEIRILFKQLTQILNLCLVWGNDSYINLFVKETLAAYFLDVLF